MSDTIKFKCNCCGEIHEEWPALTYKYPNNYSWLTATEKNEIAELNDDFCIINNVNEIDRFVRGTLTQKIKDDCQELEYGFWVSLSEKSFEDYSENFKKETEEKSYFGWLCNDLPDYEYPKSIPTTVITRGNGLRPEIIPHKDFEHKFVEDYYNGISKSEAEKRINRTLGIKENLVLNQNAKNKWWKIWKK
jgi:hypothetical protein